MVKLKTKHMKTIGLILVFTFCILNTIYSQYKVSPSGDLYKFLEIHKSDSVSNYSLNDLYLTDSSTGINVDIMLAKMKTNQTRIYFKCSKTTTLGISNLYILLKLGNGKIYTSKHPLCI